MDSEFFKEADYDFEAETTEMFSKIEMLKPEDVADAVLYALSTPPYVLVRKVGNFGGNSLTSVCCR